MHQLPESNSKNRIAGIVMLAIGIALSVYLKHIYDTGASMSSYIVCAAPVLVIFGIALAINPGLMHSRNRPNKLSPAGAVIMVVAVVVGIVLREVVFSDWK